MNKINMVSFTGNTTNVRAININTDKKVQVVEPEPVPHVNGSDPTYEGASDVVKDLRDELRVKCVGPLLYGGGFMKDFVKYADLTATVANDERVREHDPVLAQKAAALNEAIQEIMPAANELARAFGVVMPKPKQPTLSASSASSS